MATEILLTSEKFCFKSLTQLFSAFSTRKSFCRGFECRRWLNNNYSSCIIYHPRCGKNVCGWEKWSFKLFMYLSNYFHIKLMFRADAAWKWKECCLRWSREMAKKYKAILFSFSDASFVHLNVTKSFATFWWFCLGPDKALLSWRCDIMWVWIRTDRGLTEKLY